MYSKLVHIYGPIYIHAYGILLALGLLLFVYLCKNNPRLHKLMGQHDFDSLVALGIVVGLFGARIWFFLTENQSWSHFFEPWYGGFSLLGGVITILALAPFVFNYYKIPLLPFLDIVCVYTPLLHFFGRLGCFFAGCCYGKSCSYFWSVTYVDPDSMAPLHITLHPTQLYSAGLFLCIFAITYFLQTKLTKVGQLCGLYLFLSSCERFIMDFFRADITHISYLPYFTLHQYVALGIAAFGGILLMRPSLQRILKA